MNYSFAKCFEGANSSELAKTIINAKGVRRAFYVIRHNINS